MAMFPKCLFRGCCSDPLIHLAIHCPSTYYSVSPTQDLTEDSIDRALIKIGYKNLPWKQILTKKKDSTQFLIDCWVAETPMLKALAEEETLFFAPDRWPYEVEKAFGRTPIPSPFELANARFNGRKLKNKLKSHDVVFLRAYSFGVSIDYIAKLFMLNEASVIDFMVRAVKDLLDSKRFLLWCMHLDFERLRSLSLAEHKLDQGILHKLKHRKKVFDEPFLYPEEFFDFITDSPVMLNLCKSGILKKQSLRVKPPFRVGHRILQEQNEEKIDKNGPTCSAEE